MKVKTYAISGSDTPLYTFSVSSFESVLLESNLEMVQGWFRWYSLASTRPQTISWTNGDKDHRRHMTSLGNIGLLPTRHNLSLTRLPHHEIKMKAWLTSGRLKLYKSCYCCLWCHCIIPTEKPPCNTMPDCFPDGWHLYLWCFHTTLSKQRLKGPIIDTSCSKEYYLHNRETLYITDKFVSI